MTLRTFASSPIRSPWVCNRPAVSMMTTSTPLLLAWAIASKATAPGSEPSGPLTNSAPARCRPERVRGPQQHAQVKLVVQMPGELSDRGRLAGAVDADHQDDRRRSA